MFKIILLYRHPEDEGLTESFVLIICKEKICDAYTDLRDPEKLKELLEQRNEVYILRIFSMTLPLN